MSLKFAANLSFLFTELADLEARYSAAKEAGFEAVEVAFPYTLPLVDVQRALESNQQRQVLLNIFPGDLSAGELGHAALPGKEKEFQDALNLSITYCKALKCDRLHIMTGKIPDPSPEATKECLLKKMEDTFIANLKYAADILSKEGILALIEPLNKKTVPNYFLNSQYQAVDMIKKVGHPNLKLQMDLFHVQQQHGNITHIIKELYPYIGHIQVAQVPDRGQPDSPGELNYNYIFQLLQELGYKGWIGCEYKPTGKTKDSFAWLTPWRNM
ncbi:putative hydroxypyruvate isomerase [Anneissia japonica]|uniref:putative hydroxypyruvate isomerase n=1 Tax=Anneissia japonica TaxID=1529436 RepID=UPI0014258695|nr:putative hydroxypyruvate isomerase [Anneissia japonica]